MRSFVWLAGMAAICLASGCTKLGMNFKSANVKQITIGQTTPEEIRKWFGPPFREETVSGSELESEVYVYEFTRVDNLSEEARDRSLVVEIVDGKVRGFMFESSLNGDSSEFSAELRNKIAAGQDQAEIEQLLGKTPGRMLLPSNIYIPSKGFEPPAGTTEVWRYGCSYSRPERNVRKSYGRYVSLFFDSSGKLLDHVYTDTMPKPAARTTAATRSE